MPIAIFYLMEYYLHNPLGEVRPKAQLFNIILFELAAAILLFLTGSVRAALRIETVAAMLYGLANIYVMRFRGHPIVPWDFYSLKTAVSVADNYSFTPTRRMVVVTIAFLLLLVVEHWLPMRIGRRSPAGAGRYSETDVVYCERQSPGRAFARIALLRVLPLVLCSVVLVVFAGMMQREDFQSRHRLYNKLFVPGTMIRYNGTVVNFVMNLAFLSVDTPQGYDKATVEDTLASYETDEPQTEEFPNIIVIMNEAFSDMAVLGDFETNRDYMPFFHSLQQNPDSVVSGSTVTGMLNVSVLGGNTANSEFEFLTGNTMAFLPQGSVPYQQYIHDEILALPGYLYSMGYDTVAMHPWRASGWERKEVYPLMGFQKCYFKNDFDLSRTVREYLTDDACVDKIIEEYENKGDNPLFVFNVTMQNHGGYKGSFPDFTPEIKVNGLDNGPVEQYLSLIELSDQSLEKLIRYFEAQEEKTVIVFFGDHQPNDVIAGPILGLQGIDSNQLTEEQMKLRYEVPYLMWANYELDSKQQIDTSANYLAAQLVEWVGLPANNYQSFLLDFMQEYPIISAMRLKDAAGNELGLDTSENDVAAYRRIQYYQLFEDTGKEK